MAKIGYIQVTRTCNQKCIICSNPPNEKFLSLQKAKQEIDKLKGSGYTGVILTGGEPTLYEKLPELIRYSFKKNIFPRIITNGQKIAQLKYLKTLQRAGLKHVHLSIFSYQNKIQAKISQNKRSLYNIKKALDNLSKVEGITVDVNTAINKYNANHLSKTVQWIVKNYPFINHFVFNNLDPYMNRVMKNPQIIPTLNDFELELHTALSFLEKNKKTFRVEKVPLCYLTDYEYASTETRKIVKKESRTVYFLDEKQKVTQKSWFCRKTNDCQRCSLNDICSGLYDIGGFYKETELYAVFEDPKKVIKKIKQNQ